MTVKNTGSFTQYGRSGSINITAANGGSLTAPTNTGLVFTAGPDGTDLWGLAGTATAVQTSANTLQLYSSFDYGATFNLLPLVAAFTAGQAVSSVVNAAFPNGIPSGPSNPFILSGSVGAFTHIMAQSSLTENSTYYCAAFPTGGTANAQTCGAVLNTSGTNLAGTTPATGTIVDFTAGLSNSAAITIALGSFAATSIKKIDGTDPATGDIVKGNRYRLIFNGTNWTLLPTMRIYAAMTQAQAVTLTAWGCDR